MNARMAMVHLCVALAGAALLQGCGKRVADSAAPLAALMQERERMQGRRVGLILSGGNIDREVFADVLAGRTPAS